MMNDAMVKSYWFIEYERSGGTGFYSSGKGLSNDHGALVSGRDRGRVQGQKVNDTSPVGQEVG